MKSRRKKQLARLNKQQIVQGITLQQAWDRMCEEFDTRHELCWFVGKHLDGDFSVGWNIYNAHNCMLVKQSGGKN